MSTASANEIVLNGGLAVQKLPAIHLNSVLNSLLLHNFNVERIENAEERDQAEVFFIIFSLIYLLF